MHRPGYLDYIGVKRFDAKGKVCGEHRFLGLFTSTAYSANPADIPLLRRKAANVVVARRPRGRQPRRQGAGATCSRPIRATSCSRAPRTSCCAPRSASCTSSDRQRFRLFVRRDPFERFLSCMIYAPRENYTTELRQKWQAILMQAFNGTSSEFNVNLSESMLARIMIIVRTTPGQIPDFDVRELEARLVAAARRWDDELSEALVETLGEARGIELFRAFGAAFPAGYREDFAARAAVPDIADDGEPVCRPAARR